jgi:hypothetical protein
MKSLSELGVTSVTTLLLPLTPTFAQCLTRLLRSRLVFVSRPPLPRFDANSPPHAYQHQSGSSSLPIGSIGITAWFAGFPPALAARLFPFVCLVCYSGREALRAFTHLAYLSLASCSLSHSLYSPVPS